MAINIWSLCDEMPPELPIFGYKLTDATTAMATEEIRQNFHRLIDALADEKSLVELYSVAELYVEQQNVLLDTQDPALLSRMEKSLQQVERGEFITNEAMQKEVKQWLGK